MDRKEGKLYTTGAFARYFGIKKDTLFYYDQIGLFSPAAVGKNGYRYYNASQIPPFGTLLSLREMNVPIEKIRAYFEAPSPEKLEEMAREQIGLLEEEIRRRKEIQKGFQEILEETEEGRAALKGQVMIQKLPAKRFIYSKADPRGQGIQIHKWWEAYDDFIRERNLKGLVSIGSLIAKERLLRGQFDRVERLFIPGGARGTLREGGEYAVFYFQGAYEKIQDAYRALLEGIQRQGFEPDGDAYEEYLISELATEDETRFVTRLTVKVRPAFLSSAIGCFAL